ncbi:asparagine synthase B [Alteromonas macleodii]|jgi:asparagine synthase (glutamine-hydrolysing)|uniref:asparagine synthase (glutamine-hydrolyzing) n=2 Tax=Alteromonas macleodii TaxID=28108 RepID=A0A1E7DGK7_ALTMA|nr:MULTISPECIES: asparagine synthase B [Alteromonas]KXJ61771.1 MAG: asparagine synthase B [Alteromonas sp. Nap_26]MCG8498147.1 asparagine synthase B [Enterobacterales bacterium]MEC7283355.1 asparagine synthase B [Pseudomonadota bacterium]NKX22427.1 asparagine synthase B [Alteromonadaceae bacterium A_SAG2]NKX30438.1 asparagine synthase B [Alteromonadaceae bacterium A_SAG1]PTT87260.1 asparagine synthase B [Pseudomonas sp. HMWF031]|tara:strand:- start:799 stop:2469 length:1671 start_codon:yes stop_codon:yes gene_type:complete
MCGIFGILDIKTDVSELRTQALDLSKLLRHRGPDWSGIWNNDNTILCHERLAIVDVDTGAQPLISQNDKQILAVNGEIYNHKQLAANLDEPYPFKTRSDCEVILPLFQQKGIDFIDELEGMFAFILYDEEQDAYLIARDHIGIIPLYTGYDEHGNFYVSSEMKALAGVCKTISEFPPGHYLWSKEGKITKYYKRDWMEYDNVKDNTSNLEELRVAFEKAVKSHMMSDVPYAVLLSGGLDSSLVSAVAAQYVAKRVEDEDKTDAWWPRLHSFAVGLEGAPDLKAAKKVADMIGTVHHEIHFTIQEGLDAIRDVIYHLETYDTTTIRAATPMYLMTRKIKAMGIKMVLSGEGSDEIFGGYLYFHKAPNAKEFHEETVRKLDRLHMFDCARANKATSAWGVEARVPFLDKNFIDVAMRLNPQDKMCLDGKMEKWILRKAFDNGETLPAEVLWRQKEQFGDGVGYSWIDSIRDFVENEVTDQQLATAEFRFPVNTPDTKEGYYYRTIFESYFPQESAARCVPGGKSIACSTAEALEWDESFKNNADPSGRSMKGVHAGES